MNTPGCEPTTRDDDALRDAVEKATGTPVTPIEYARITAEQQEEADRRQFRRASEGAVDVAQYELTIEKLRIRLDHERKQTAKLRDQLAELERVAIPTSTSFIDARVVEEAKKASRHDRERVAYLEQKLDLAERALRGLGLVFA